MYTPASFLAFLWLHTVILRMVAGDTRISRAHPQGPKPWAQNPNKKVPGLVNIQKANWKMVDLSWIYPLIAWWIFPEFSVCLPEGSIKDTPILANPSPSGNSSRHPWNPGDLAEEKMSPSEVTQNGNVLKWFYLPYNYLNISKYI